MSEAPPLHVEPALRIVDDTVTSIGDARFDRALFRLRNVDPHAHVRLNSTTGLATKVDGTFASDVPPAAQGLPKTDRAAAAAVSFLDRYGSLFGIAGWHRLTPTSATPLGDSLWFHFDAQMDDEHVVHVSVCTSEDTITCARVDEL